MVETADDRVARLMEMAAPVFETGRMLVGALMPTLSAHAAQVALAVEVRSAEQTLTRDLGV